MENGTLNIIVLDYCWQVIIVFLDYGLAQNRNNFTIHDPVFRLCIRRYTRLKICNKFYDGKYDMSIDKWGWWLYNCESFQLIKQYELIGSITYMLTKG